MSIQRLEELQEWLQVWSIADETAEEDRGSFIDSADAIGELIARRRVEEAKSKLA